MARTGENVMLYLLLSIGLIMYIVGVIVFKGAIFYGCCKKTEWFLSLIWPLSVSLLLIAVLIFVIYEAIIEILKKIKGD